MSGDERLWGELPEQRAPEPAARAAPRLRRPERDQVGWHAAAIDDLIAPDHPARAVWAFVAALDLSELHDEVKAREGAPGQAPPDPALMLALWLYATVEGVGSARQLDRLCDQHLAYRWLCGGVSTNYPTLSDFRIAHAGVLEKLLARGVASLVAEGLVKLEVLAQDGMKVRASAGAGSFRRRRRLEELEAAAKKRVRRLRDEVDDDPAAGERRKQAAKERAAREQAERLAAALERMKELEAERARREKTNKGEVAKQKEPRASSTDPEARVMKMADGGFRPAYTMQIVSAVEGHVVVAVDVETSGSDRGLARLAIERLREAAIAPKVYLVDGGFAKNADIEWAHGNGIRLTCPPTQSKHGTDPFAVRDDDGPGIADWRRRMASDPGKALYQLRAQAECPNAWARRMGLSRLLVRGKEKARATLLLFALAHNMLRAFALRAVPAAPAPA